MPKKCSICGEEAKYQIKDTSDYYCEECAEENFSDIALLKKVEEQATKIKNLINSAGQDDEEDSAEQETS